MYCFKLAGSLNNLPHKFFFSRGANTKDKFYLYLQDVEQYSMENIVTDTRQLEKDNNMMKTELENRIEDLAKQTKSGGDNIKEYIIPTIKIIIRKVIKLFIVLCFRESILFGKKFFSILLYYLIF